MWRYTRNTARTARRPKFWFGRARRWSLPGSYYIMPRRRFRFGTRPKHETTAPAQETKNFRIPTWPVLASSSSLEVRIAQTLGEIEAAQRLRYCVFYEEGADVTGCDATHRRRTSVTSGV